MRIHPRGVVPCALLLSIVSLSPLSAARSNTTVTVMTQNMDAGTDLGFALAYINTSTPTIGIDLTYQEIQQSDFEGRAAILAKQIAQAHPDLVSLQEVTSWFVSPTPFSLPAEVDQLQLLLAALADEDQDYLVVDVNVLTMLAAPMSDGDWLGFMDSDVVLVRNDAAIEVSNIDHGYFTPPLVLPTLLGNLTILQGWISAEVTVDGETFTFVDTHLVSSFPGMDLSELQAGQAAQLAELFGSSERVIIAGDFNSNVTHTPPEQTPSVEVMTDAGFIDTWPVANHGQPGFTWPLYLEDGLRMYPNGPFERIDLILEKGLGIDSVKRVGWTGKHASDHAGVVATLSFDLP